MNWNALKNAACPKDGKALEEKKLGYECVNTDCGFFITHAKFKTVVHSLYNSPRFARRGGKKKP